MECNGRGFVKIYDVHILYGGVRQPGGRGCFFSFFAFPPEYSINTFLDLTKILFCICGLLYYPESLKKTCFYLRFKEKKNGPDHYSGLYHRRDRYLHADEKNKTPGRRRNGPGTAAPA